MVEISDLGAVDEMISGVVRNCREFSRGVGGCVSFTPHLLFNTRTTLLSQSRRAQARHRGQVLCGAAWTCMNDSYYNMMLYVQFVTIFCSLLYRKTERDDGGDLVAGSLHLVG